MNRIVVSCGLFNHAIYAQDVVSDSDVCDVTHMTINAVRDYMVNNIVCGNSTDYSWKRNDGKTVRLVCTVEDANG